MRARAVDFETWVTPWHTRLLRFAHLVTGERHAVDEALQDALTSAWSHWDRIAEADDPERYVRRTIANAHVSAWRRFRSGSVRPSSSASTRTWTIQRSRPSWARPSRPFAPPSTRALAALRTELQRQEADHD